MGSMCQRGKDRRGLDVWELRVSLGHDAKSDKYPSLTERFHGPKTNATRRPDENGAVEMGCEVLPRMRRRGFAGESGGGGVKRWTLVRSPNRPSRLG